MTKKLTRSEEELRFGKEEVDAGAVVARKHTDVERVSEVVPRGVEDAQVERVETRDRDSGEIETQPDGSISIPLFEEQLVITKRLVVRERVIVRKRTVTEQQRIEADLRRERLDIEETGDVEVERAVVNEDNERETRKAG